MNYGEKLGYWYLRLNGFFLLENFIVHRTPRNQYSSDIDLIGVRMPYVYEEIGGHNNDWDKKLLDTLNPKLPTGVLCEVKTGDYNDKYLFQEQYVAYAADRFGFIPNMSNHSNEIANNTITEIEFNGISFQILKLFISNKESNRTDFLQLHLNDTRAFITNRIQKYRIQKWQDRMLFDCDVLGDYIDRNHIE